MTARDKGKALKSSLCELCKSGQFWTHPAIALTRGRRVHFERIECPQSGEEVGAESREETLDADAALLRSSVVLLWSGESQSPLVSTAEELHSAGGNNSKVRWGFRYRQRRSGKMGKRRPT
jgi:hypothetical protein